MTYLSDKRKQNTRSKIVGGVLVVAALLTFFWKTIVVEISPVTLPVVETYASSRNGVMAIPHAIASYFTSRSAYEEKISSLELEIERLENMMALSLRTEENIAASTTLSEDTALRAYPIIEDMTGLYDTILISKGFVDGVAEGSKVYLRGRQVVGTVTQVHKKTSLVSLYSASGSTVRGVIPELSLAFTLEGAGGGSFMALLPKTLSPTEGMAVYLESDPTMILGTVVRIENDPQDIALRLYIRGAYNPSNSHTLYVE